MKNIQNLTIDINKKPFQTITANKGEVGSRFIRITIVDNGNPVDLTDVTISLYAKKPDGKNVFNSVTVEDKVNGIVLAELTSQILIIEGIVNLTLLLIKDDAKLCSKQFLLHVDNSIVDDEAIESSNEFDALTTSLSKVNEWNKYFEDTSGKIEEKYTERLNNVSSQLEHKENKSKFKILAINESTVTGDCILLTTNRGKNIVIDTGASSGWNEINAHLSKLSNIDLLIITHYHLDHIGNLENVLKLCDSDTMIILPNEPNFDKFISNGEEFRQHTSNVYGLCDKYKLNKTIAYENMELMVDDVKLRFLNCSNEYFDNYYNEESEFHPGETDYNNFSIVTEITHNNNKMLFCSDISTKAQELLAPVLQRYKLVQAPHHSVDSFCNRSFVETIKTDMVFCCSYYTSSVYRSEFAKYHMIRNVPFYVTRYDGDIKITSDGFNLHCENKSLFKTYNMKEVLSGFGGTNFMYYSFEDIMSDYTSTTTIEEVFQNMTNGSLAVVNFNYGHAVTPSTISSYGGVGILNKYSNNKASALLFDGKKSSFNCYVGIWFNGEGDIKWNRIANHEAVATLENKVKISSYSHYTHLSSYGIVNTDTALDFIKKMPNGATYEGNLYKEFASDKLSDYGGIGKILKLTNGLNVIIEMYDANSNNNQKWIGKYNSTVADEIKWHTVEMAKI